MKKTITTIEITDEEIKLLQMRKGGASFEDVYSDVRSAQSSADEDISDCLKHMMTLLPNESDENILIVPRRQVILKQMAFPADEHDEVHDMIGLQLMNSLPYADEDIIYRFQRLGRDDRGYTRVLVIIILKEMSRRYYKIMQQAGLKDGKITISSLGIHQWLTYQEKNQKNTDRSPALLIHVDARHCELCFCDDQKLWFSRSLPYGKEYLAMGNIDEMMEQIKVSLETYCNEQFGSPLEKIWILSSEQEVEILQGCLEQELNVPVTIVNPLQGMRGVIREQESAVQLQNAGAVTAGLGLILSDNSDDVNLAPIEIHQQKQKQKQFNRIVKFICLMSAVSVLGICGQLLDNANRQSSLDELKRQELELQPRVKEAIDKIQFVQLYDQKYKNVPFIPEIVDELNRITPDDITYKNLSFNKNGEVIIQGYAKSNAGINDLQSRLIRSSEFHDVDLRFSTKRRVSNMFVRDFKIASQLGAGEGNAL